MTTYHDLDPTERGETYVAILCDLMRARDDAVLHNHYTGELDQLIRPFAHMTVNDLNRVLEGIHAALSDVLPDTPFDARRTEHHP